MPRQRLDLLLVQGGLAESREQAQRLIRAGRVRVDGRPAEKPGHSFPVDAPIELKEKERYASRGGLKLEGAWKTFGFDPAGKTCLDIGSSTGGFTDFMLDRKSTRLNSSHYS